MQSDDPAAADAAAEPAAAAAHAFTWTDIAGALAGAGLARGRPKWRGIRIVDTVFIGPDGAVERWVFTAKSGEATAKKRAEGSDKIVDRFTRFALANPHNKEQLVAVATYRDGTRRALSRSELTAALSAGNERDDGAIAWVQCFLRPRAGHNSFIRCSWQAQHGQVKSVWVSPLYATAPDACAPERETQLLAAAHLHAAALEKVRSDVTAALQQLAAFLHTALGAEVVEASADFIVDDNGQVWLSAVQRATAAPAAPQNAVPDAATRSQRHAVPALAPAAEARNSGTGGGGGAGLIYRTPSGVYSARCRLEDLRGLAAWRQRGDDARVWEMSAPVGGSSAGAAGAADDADGYEALREERHQMAARGVLLAMETQAFLEGDATDGGGGGAAVGGVGTEAYAQAWREADRAAQLRLASANPQAYYAKVSVCGNCRRIVQRLDAIRAASFGLPQPTTAPIDGSATLRSHSAPLKRPPDDAASGSARAAAPSSARSGDQTQQQAGGDMKAAAAGPEQGGGRRDASPTTAAAAAAAALTDEPLALQHPAAALYGAAAKPRARSKAGGGTAAARRKATPAAAAAAKGVSPIVLAQFAAERDRAARAHDAAALPPMTPQQPDMALAQPVASLFSYRGAAAAAAAAPAAAVGSSRRGSSAGTAGAAPQRQPLLERLERAASDLAMRSAQAEGEEAGGSAAEAEFRARTTAAAAAAASAALHASGHAGSGGGGVGAESGSGGAPAVEAAFGAAFARAAAGVGSSGGGGGGGAAAAVCEALRSRVAALEGESAGLRRRAAQLEAERAAEAQRGERAERRLAQAQQEFSRAMAEKDEDHATRVLELQERHNRALQRHLQSGPPSVTAALSPQRPASAFGSATAAAAAAPTELLAQVRRLSAELEAQRAAAAAARSTAAAERARDVAAAAAASAGEAAESRRRAQALEDRSTALASQMSEAARQINLLNVRLEETERRRGAAEADAEAARREAGVLRQAAAQVASMEGQGGDAGGEGGGGLAATTEAKLRTLQNKVEYLKAQLASEQTLRGEMEAALAAARARAEAERCDARAAADALDESRRAAVAALQARAQSQLDAQAGEAFALQGKVRDGGGGGGGGGGAAAAI
ncbi:hypothetical protein JKP88DRAFT_279625 [Tribonema minus]|uniref:Uncharacterized protein n=1 Tax=Tribonema minus TaxID=303371 RepID=A0A835Z097_9STRA|nr:hypothetical protein JKP88DRAFT_279625 [Tribonema minus]